MDGVCNMSEGIVILAHSTEQTDYKLNDAVRRPLNNRQTWTQQETY